MPVRRGQLPPAGMINELESQAQAASNFGGAGVNQFPDGAQFLPPESDSEEIWMLIFGSSGSSSSSTVSQSGGSSGSSGSAGQTSNRYAWNQGMTTISSSGVEDVVVDPSGLSGTPESNPAIEIQGRVDVPEGAKVRGYLSPSRNAWHFVYNGPVSTSSTPLKLTIDCGSGLITVNNATPSSSSSDTSSPSTPNPKGGGGAGAGGGGGGVGPELGG